uniref:Uncharacterized protein n=1 Tax=Oryza punctata TaxID=4537 RepID=A0A0E0M5L8_ORYPU
MVDRALIVEDTRKEEEALRKRKAAQLGLLHHGSPNPRINYPAQYHPPMPQSSHGYPACPAPPRPLVPAQPRTQRRSFMEANQAEHVITTNEVRLD